MDDARFLAWAAIAWLALAGAAFGFASCVANGGGWP